MVENGFLKEKEFQTRFRKEKRGKNMSDLVRVAVDAMGGDYAPVEPVKGAVEAVNADERVKVQLVGQVDVIEKELQKYTYRRSGLRSFRQPRSLRRESRRSMRSATKKILRSLSA